MLKCAIPIERASEKLIKSLIDTGILYVDENGIHVTENRKVLPPASKQDQSKTLHRDYTTEKEGFQ